jgi:hypothetical protein
MQGIPVDRASTLLLKGILLAIGIGVLALCIYVFPRIATVTLRELPEYTWVLYPALAGLFATPLPFFFALYQALKLLHYIDTDHAFSELSVRALRSIKWCAIAMSALYATCLPMLFVIAERDDAPGLGAMGLAIVFAPLIVATFAAVLQKLVLSAVMLKEEHDLTV